MQHWGILTMTIIRSFIATFTGWPVFYPAPLPLESEEVIWVVCQRQESQRTMMSAETSTPKRPLYQGEMKAHRENSRESHSNGGHFNSLNNLSQKTKLVKNMETLLL